MYLFNNAWPFDHLHVKKWKRCPSDLSGLIPFLCLLLLWEKMAPHFQILWSHVPHTSLPPPALRLLCTPPVRNASIMAWLLNNFSFTCSTVYHLLLQDTTRFCPTPSDLSSSQTLTPIPHPRTLLSSSHATDPFKASLFYSQPLCPKFPHHPRDRQWYNVSPLHTVPSATHLPFFFLLIHGVNLQMTVPGMTLAFHGLDLSHRLTAVRAPRCRLLSSLWIFFPKLNSTKM